MSIPTRSENYLPLQWTVTSTHSRSTLPTLPFQARAVTTSCASPPRTTRYSQLTRTAGKSSSTRMYVATDTNSILAIAPDSGKELFHTNLGPALPKAQLVCPDMGPQIGVTGTPVIDPATQTLYVAAKTFENGRHSFSLHALDIASGQEKSGSPVVIAATFPRFGTNNHDGTAV